jgi:hypothetical protein
MAFLMRMKSKASSSRSEPPVAAVRPTQSPSTPFTPSMDRRREARRWADRREPMTAQLIGGVDVRLCNVSTRGVMFESSMRVVVGAHVTLRLRTSNGVVTIPGEVVRSQVSATRHGRLRYQTALALQSDCPIDNDELRLSPTTEVVSVVDGEVIDADSVALVTIDNKW